MGMDPYTYVGFGAVVSNSKLNEEVLYAEENEYLLEGHPDEVHVITGESNNTFITYDAHFITTDAMDVVEVEDITGVLGSTRQVADKIRAVIRDITTDHLEPMLKPYIFTTWN